MTDQHVEERKMRVEDRDSAAVDRVADSFVINFRFDLGLIGQVLHYLRAAWELGYVAGVRDQKRKGEKE